MSQPPRAWSAADVPDQTGRIALIAGANSGISLEAARVPVERLLATAGSRVVTISSGGHRMGKIDFDGLNWERSYGRWRAYGRSKLANLLFTYELQHRLENIGARTIAVAAHPGASSTNLGRRAPGDPGAPPTLRAATDPGALGGDYFGPAGLGELRGAPRRVESNAASHDPATAHRLWEVSAELTGVDYATLEGSELGHARP